MSLKNPEENNNKDGEFLDFDGEIDGEIDGEF